MEWTCWLIYNSESSQRRRQSTWLRLYFIPRLKIEQTRTTSKEFPYHHVVSFNICKFVFPYNLNWLIIDIFHCASDFVGVHLFSRRSTNQHPKYIQLIAKMWNINSFKYLNIRCCCQSTWLLFITTCDGRWKEMQRIHQEMDIQRNGRDLRLLHLRRM